MKVIPFKSKKVLFDESLLRLQASLARIDELMEKLKVKAEDIKE